MTLAENLEVLNLRAIAGEYDIQERHTDIGKLPVFLENQQKGNYTVRLDPAANGSDAAIQINQSFDGRPGDREVAAQPRLPPCALAGDRPRPAQRDVLARRRHARLAVADRGHRLQPRPGVADEVGDARRQAGERAAGQDRAGQEGRRRVPAAHQDGKGRLRIELVGDGGQFMPFPRIGEMIAQHVKKIGIQIDVLEQERTLMERRRDGNELQMVIWANDGSELIYSYPPHALPIRPDVVHGAGDRQVVRLERARRARSPKIRRC